MARTKQKGKKRYTILKDIRRNPLSYLMLIPAALYTIVFGYMTIPFMFSAFQPDDAAHLGRRHLRKRKLL